MTKILLIDDDPDVLTVMSVLLQKEGYEVVTAARRDEALQKLQDEMPALILLDVLLSGADGRELCRLIKTSPQTKDIPVVMYSGHPGAAVEFQSYGADDFLPKPFQTAALLQKLQQLVRSEK